ncbi:hypothetical protein GY45DRAFT_1325871 [Cubamyces sp. BRFM 1775]|nr:hypothetical protein GY45DRAFT_1325871 [Cubamyces sp. BRFM 1775]
MELHLASQPHLELAPMMQMLPVPPPAYSANVEASRQQYKTIFIEISRSHQRPHLPLDESYVTEDHNIPVEGGGIAIRCYRPTANDDDTFPLLVWTHGGGWLFGDLDSDDYYLKHLTVDMRMAIVNVEYRLAPEHPFPVGLNDSYAALKWSVDNAHRIKADLAKGFIVAGQSIGANFTAVLTHRAQQDPTFSKRPVTGQALQMPVTVHPDAVPDELRDTMTAFEQNAHAAGILLASHMRDYYDTLQGPPTHPELSPLLQPSFEGLPPAYVQVCGLDPVRDDGIAYTERLKAAGVPTICDIYPGAPHCFHLVFPDTEIAKKLDDDFRNGIRWLLARAPMTQ